jgi:hypothetical protein
MTANAFHKELDFELVRTLSKLHLPPQYGIFGVLQFKRDEASPLVDFLFAVRLARREMQSH